MTASVRLALVLSTAVLATALPACNGPPSRDLRQSQFRSFQLYQQNQALARQQMDAQRGSQSLASQNAQLQQQLSSQTATLNTLQQRIDNLQAERQEMEKRYVSLVNRTKSEGSPLSDQATKDLEDLARRFPDFDFDPSTGVSKFHSDILFESGSSELRSGASPILQEFVNVLNKPDSQQLNILVVGHTDDRPISKASTRSRHGDNWDLSAHRAVSVTRTMSKHGLKDNRMGVAGYGPHQPLAPNTDDKSRQRNRRVEIFVLAPNAAIAGWETPQRN